MSQVVKKLASFVSNGINVIAGTTPKQVFLLSRALIDKSHKIELFAARGKDIFFDYDSHPPMDIAALLDKGMDLNDLVNPDEFVAAALPVDQESLAKAEANGSLALLPQGWYRSPGASLENLGASGDPRIGYTLALLNGPSLRTRFHKCVGERIDYDGHKQLLFTGLDGADKPTSLILVNLCCTAVGGMSSGAVVYFSKHVKTDVLSFGARAKTVFHVLLRGDLPVTDVERADINETNLLKHLRAVATGHYVDPVSGELTQCPFDLLFLQSNRNCHGRLPSLERLISHEAHRQNALSNGPLGESIRERLADIQNWDFDSNGDPLVGFSMSCSYLRWDSSKVVNYYAYKAASILASFFATKQVPAEAKKEALALIRMHGVVETPQDHALTSQVMNPAEFGGENVIQILRANFADRIGGTWGFKRAIALAEAINAISTTDFSNIYETAMVREAKKILGQTISHLNKYIEQKMSAPMSVEGSGARCFDVLSILTWYRQAIETSRQVVMDKIGQIQQFAQHHEDVANNALEELQTVRERTWLWRLYHPFLSGRIAACLETSGRIFLESQLEILSCRVVVRDLLDGLINFLDSKVAELGMLEQNLRQVFASCKQQAQTWVRRPTTFDTPVGFDLVSEKFLNESFARTVAELGGRENLNKNLVTRFLSKHGSAAILLGKAPDEIENTLKEICQAVFEPQIKQTDVVAEFLKLYPGERMQLQFFQQLVFQSEGRVLTVGEIGKTIVWLKFVTVPDACYIDPIKKLIERADTKPGNWKVVVDNNHDAISIVQLRGGISLTPIVARCGLNEPENWEKLSTRAINRVIAMMVPPNPSDRQLQMVLAKAIVTGQLLYDEANGFNLHFSDSEHICLGKEVNAAMNTLQHYWPYIVRIESTFGHCVVVDDNAIAQKIKELRERRTVALPNSDPCLDFVDDTAFSDLDKQLELLIPWARRLRVNIGKR